MNNDNLKFLLDMEEIRKASGKDMYDHLGEHRTTYIAALGEETYDDMWNDYSRQHQSESEEKYEMERKVRQEEYGEGVGGMFMFMLIIFCL